MASLRNGKNYLRTRAGWIKGSAGGGDSTKIGIDDLFQGYITCTANPNYPAATKDMYWKLTGAGKIGGASGTAVDGGEILVCLATNAGGTEAAVGTSFTIEEGNARIGVNPTPVVRTNNAIVGANTINANISKLDTAIGVTPTATTIIAAANSVNVNLSALDVATAALQSAATFNSTSATIAGAGANQGAATAVATGIAVVSAADGAVGVRLPAVSTTKVIALFNIVAAQDLLIYPATGEYINAAAQNASIKFSHATDVSSVVCTYQSAGKWTITAIHGTIS